MKKEHLLTGAITGLAMLSLATSINRGEPVIVRAQSSTQIEYIQKVINHIDAEGPAQIERICYDVPLSADEQAGIQDICIMYGIDMRLVLAIAQKESGFDEAAVGDKEQSLGMYQIQPRYWSHVYGSELDLLNKYDATIACCEVLSYLYEKYGSTERVLNAYNTGNPDKYNGYSASILKIREEIRQIWYV